jgi:hypothetical protein
LDKFINDGKKVLIFDDDLDILHLIYDGLKYKEITNVEIWHCIEEASDYKYSTYIMRKEMDEILEIYNMYDFSDKVIVVSNSNQYGSLFNYVKTGILTKQEMVDSLLYKI